MKVREFEDSAMIELTSTQSALVLDSDTGEMVLYAGPPRPNGTAQTSLVALSVAGYILADEKRYTAAVEAFQKYYDSFVDEELQ